MRHRITNYTISGQTITLDENVTIEDIRLIVNETKHKLICSSFKKENITVNGNIITVPVDISYLSANDELTIEIDRGESIEEIADIVRFEAGRFQRDVDLLAARFREIGVDIREGATFTELIEDANEWTWARTGIWGIPTNTEISVIPFSHQKITKLVCNENPGSLARYNPFVMSKIEELYLPNWGTYIEENVLKNLSKLRVLDIRKNKFTSSGNYETLSASVDLIDLYCGESFDSNVDMKARGGYFPTNAIKDYDESGEIVNNLVPDEYKAEYPTNRAYWNFNMRRHFAAFLKDRSQLATKYTITFRTDVYNAMEQETKDAFTSKGWNLAAA